MGKLAANRSKKVQAHFELPEDQWENFLAILPSLGYSSASEFLREKVREALKESRLSLSQRPFTTCPEPKNHHEDRASSGDKKSNTKEVLGT
jgi:Arc/MetJ-type ribon-helix-helix transcriptional regulator